MDTCSFCRGPFHIASGDIVGDMRPDSKGYPLCGACVKEMRQWMRGHLNRKWSKTSFYAHAQAPVPAVERLFRFRLYRRTDPVKHTYEPFYAEATGVNFWDAAAKVQAIHPGIGVPAYHTKGSWRGEGESWDDPPGTDAEYHERMVESGWPSK